MGAARLFHAVVVVGAGVGTSCGARVDRASQESSGEVPPVVVATEGGALPRADAFWPSRCASESQFRCSSYEPLEGCLCDPSAPRTPEDCGGPAKFECRQLICEPGKACPAYTNVDCRCVPDAPSDPTGCAAGSGQFECAAYAPVYKTCRCNPDRPGNPTDCTPSDVFHCVTYAPTYYACECAKNLMSEADCTAQGCPYICVSQNPRYGCECQCVTVIK
jgi:hypothetical protein